MFEGLRNVKVVVKIPLNVFLVMLCIFFSNLVLFLPIRNKKVDTYKTVLGNRDLVVINYRN